MRILGCREEEEEEEAEEATAVVEGDLRGWEWEWKELVSQHNHKQNASATKYLPLEPNGVVLCGLHELGKVLNLD